MMPTSETTISAAETVRRDAAQMSERFWTATLPAIPDWRAYSGNTRYAHPMQEHRVVKRIRQSWGELLELVTLPKATFEQFSLWYTFRCPNLKHVPRDWDNIMRATKPLTDALQEYGIIRNDSRAHMVAPPYLWVEKGERPETLIQIAAVLP